MSDPSIFQHIEDHKSKNVLMMLQIRPKIVHFRNSYCETPLIAAVRCRHFDLVKLFVEYKADLNAQDILGNTALHIAAQLQGEDHICILNFLLESGADVNIENALHHTPLTAAAHSENRNALCALLQFNAQFGTRRAITFIPI